MTAIDLSIPQALYPDPKAIQQFNLTANLDLPGQTAIYLIIEVAIETVLDF